MSQIDIVPEDRHTCSLDGCDTEFTASRSVAGSYCSRDCRDRAADQRFLNAIEQDHRFCWNCFRQRKEIERVPDEARRGRGKWTAEALIGFEFLTEHAEEGPYGIECKCGGINHDVDWGGRRSEPFLWYLRIAGLTLYREGQRDQDINIVVLADELYSTDDLELAVGRALLA
jgi:hypothetical protein